MNSNFETASEIAAKLEKPKTGTTAIRGYRAVVEGGYRVARGTWGMTVKYEPAFGSEQYCEPLIAVVARKFEAAGVEYVARGEGYNAELFVRAN